MLRYEDTKRRLNANQREAWATICEISMQYYIEAAIIENYQFRLKHKNTTIDIYPKSEKFCILSGKHYKNHVWGRYENLERWIKRKFNLN